MRALAQVGLAAALLTCAAPRGRAAQPAAVCWRDEVAAARGEPPYWRGGNLAGDVAVAQGDDPDEVRGRQMFGIPALDPTDTATVTEDAVCARLAAAVRPTPSRVAAGPLRVAAARVGRYFVVHLEGDTAGEFKSVYILNERLRRVGGWTGP